MNHTERKRERAQRETRERWVLEIYVALIAAGKTYSLPHTIEADAVARADRLLQELDKRGG